MHTESDCQQKLKDLGFDPGPVDNVFGVKSLEAYNLYRRNKGEAPVAPYQFTLASVSAELFPEEKPMATPTAVTVDTQNPLASTSNWAMLISIITTIAPFIGLHLPSDFSDTILHAVSAALALYALVRKLFFTKTVSTLVANKL